MLYRIRFEKKAEQELKSLPKAYKIRISRALSALAINPFVGKKLKGKFTGSRSIRIWPFRIIYKIVVHEITITVIRIRHRKDVYK